MTKAEIVESVLLRLSGGRLSADVDVRREDIFVALDAAIQEALEEKSKEQLRSDIGRLRTIGTPGEDVSVQFSKTYTLSTQEDSARNLFYAILPGKPYQSGDVTAIHSAGPVGSMTERYLPAQSGAYVGNLGCMGISFYWYENVNGEHRLYISSLSKNCDVLVRLALDPGEVDNDTDLLLPKGIDMKVIEKLLRLFSFTHPADVMITDTDETRAQK